MGFCNYECSLVTASEKVSLCETECRKIICILVKGAWVTSRVLWDSVSQSVCMWLRVLGLVFHVDILPRRHPYVGHLKSMCCPIIVWPTGSRGTSMVPFVGIDSGWKPGGSKIDEKSSLLSDDSAASSSEDMSTTAGCREVTCMRGTYANALQIGVASVIHPFRPFAALAVEGCPKPFVSSRLV